MLNEDDDDVIKKPKTNVDIKLNEKKWREATPRIL
jgi:hypothetical protein